MAEIKNKELILKAKQGDERSMEELLTLYDGLIKKIASYYFYHLSVKHLDLEELVSEGQIGFIQAVNRFDMEKGFQLSTYVTYGVRNSILNAMREGSIIKFSSRDVAGQMKKNKDKENEKTALFNIELIDTPERFDNIYNLNKPNNSYEEDGIEDSVIESLETKEVNNMIKEALCLLSSEERLIIEHYFGFIDGKQLNLKKISCLYNIPYPKIRKSKNIAVDKIKNFLKESDNNNLYYNFKVGGE